MASNSFGTLFRVTTWGESHGPAIGCVIDGCPANLDLSEADIQSFLDMRRPGNSSFVSERKEKDQAQLLSGIFEGKTTGAPISILIWNQDHNLADYEPIKQLYRPGHANFSYLAKYGIFDWRGGSRASARETACRVAAGAVAEKILASFGIKIISHLKQIGDITTLSSMEEVLEAERNIRASPIFCADSAVENQMLSLLQSIKSEGDSIGGIVETIIQGAPIGLGDPIYEKLEAKLASAMMSLPASKGFEIGEGFASVYLKGSQNNDSFEFNRDKVIASSNHAGGTLGGISTGENIYFKVVFKPTSSIKKKQMTADFEGNPIEFQLPDQSRHDPCVAIRAVPVVRAMSALVLVDALLMNASADIKNFTGSKLSECRLSS